MVDSILQGIQQVICYLDKLVTGRTDQEHLENLEKVFQRLQEYGVTLRKDKCLLFKESVEHLGHHIDASGVHTSGDKIKAIVNAPSPRNLPELRSFLGLLNYYAKFIPN